jgi:hypothetical protein
LGDVGWVAAQVVQIADGRRGIRIGDALQLAGVVLVVRGVGAPDPGAGKAATAARGMATETSKERKRGSWILDFGF